VSRIVIRPAYPSDLIWVKGVITATLRDNSAFCKGVHPATLDSLVNPVLATYQVLVAADTRDVDSVLGFIVYRDSTTVGFLYVRSQFRRGGIGLALLKHAGIERGTVEPLPEIACPFMVTRMDGLRGQAFGALAESKGYRLRFRPYLPMEIGARLQHGDVERSSA
jgi:ribosomal protein S18 acetylase RimI-like enzyme